MMQAAIQSYYHPGWLSAFAFDINDSGAVVGEYPVYQGGFIYNAGTYTELFRHQDVLFRQLFL